MKFRKNYLFLGITLCLLLAFSFQLLFNKPIEKADAATQTGVTITNGSFNSSPNSYYLDSSPSGWTLIKSGVNSTSGVINTNTDRFDSYLNTYRLSENPGTYSVDKTDTKVLMINAETSDSQYNSVNQGYKSNDITLNAYSYYYFSVVVKAENGAVGSVYLTGLDEVLKFENLSNTSWKEYKFYISTGSQSEKVNFELWLGNRIAQSSPNAVFFDNVTGYQISQAKYDNEAKSDNFNKSLVIAKDYITSFANSDFETGMIDGWERISAFPINTEHKVINVLDPLSMGSYTYLGSDNLSGNFALWLASKEVPSSSFGYKSSKIALPAFAIYKVSFNAKVDNDTTATVVLKETDKVSSLFEEDYYTPETSSLTINSNDTSNTFMNSYRTYSFYVKGHALFETEFYLELYLGTETEAKSGSVVFDNFTIETLTQKTLDDVSSNSYNNIIELKTETEDPSVDNGNFNDGYSEDLSSAYPITPNDWTANNNGNTVGIINTNTTIFENIKSSIGGLANPGNPEGYIGTDNEYNNILMLWNEQVSHQSITSNKVSLTKFDGKTDVYYNLSFSYKTLASNSATANFNLQLLDQNGNKIYEREIANSSSWQIFNLYIENGFYTNSLQIKFSLGTDKNPTQGYLFIDNVSFDKQNDMKEDGFNAIITNAYTRKVDFKNAFINTDSLINDEQYEVLGFTSALESEDNGSIVANSGVISTTSNIFDVIADNQSTNEKMLYIQTMAEAKYTLTSIFKFDLTSNTQYKITMNIKTVLPAVDEEYKEKFGLNFNLTGTQGKFENIKTNGEWETYTFVVNVTQNVKDAQYKFTANTQNATAGLFFIDGINIEKIDSDTYTSLYDENKDNSSYYFVGDTDIKEEDDDKEPTEEAKAEFNWLIIPSLITALALIIALVGFILRRINFKKYQKKIKNEYDRKKTLYRDVIRKQAQDMRDKELKQLNEELKEIDGKIEILENEHKELLANQRKEKGKKVDKQVEKSFKAYAQKHTTLSNNKEKLVEKIKHVNSSDYLLELQKKINMDMAKNLKEENQKLTEQNKPENK